MAAGHCARQMAGGSNLAVWGKALQSKPFLSFHYTDSHGKEDNVNTQSPSLFKRHKKSRQKPAPAVKANKI